MPVSGRELASLDFANLIGGPLNAVIEAQAKSAITTANFIREVGFDKDGKVVNVDFSYNRKNDNGSDQEFTLTLPFISMLPIPYITVTHAEIEFNAKITSTTESKSDSNFSQVVDASVGGNYWFVSAKLQSKTSYQRSSSASDREERTFDMHVKVEARNQDMPAGTERILTLLENTIEEKTNHKVATVGLSVTWTSKDGTTIRADGGDAALINDGATFEFAGKTFTVKTVGRDPKIDEKDPADVKPAASIELTLDPTVPDSITTKTISVTPKP